MGLRTQIVIERRPPAALPGLGELYVGVGEVDITPALGCPLAGYSLGGGRGERLDSPLHARAFYLRDEAGHAMAWCIVDLLCGSRYLLESIAQRTAPLGVGVGQLLLLGTHTHTGPGGYFGNGVYDMLASSRPGFDRALADELVAGAARAISMAAAGAEPAVVGVASEPLWGVSGQASLAAFEQNREARAWWSHGYPGAGAPHDLGLRGRAVDPRLVMLAFASRGGDLLGAIGMYAMHATTRGEGSAAYCADWPGHAVASARAALGAPHACIAFAQRAAGDANALSPSTPPGVALARLRGEQVGRAAARLCERALASAVRPAVAMRWGEMVLGERCLGGEPATELAPWCFGSAALGGGEDARSPLYRLGIARGGGTRSTFAKGHPQHPKRRALGPLQALAAAGLDAPEALPMHVLRLGDHVFATVPGEPTAMVGHRIERRLRAALGAASVTVLGYAGDYGGYFTTPEEYSLQHYEGASTLFGRHSATHLERLLCDVATGARPAPTTNRATLRTLSLHRGS